MDELESVVFTGVNDDADWNASCSSGDCGGENGHWVLHNQYVTFTWANGGPATEIPEHNFKIALDVKMTSTGNMGIFNIIGVLNGGGHDRHIGVHNSAPYYRTWTGSGYHGNFNGINA